MPFIEQQLVADGVTTEGRHIVTEAVHAAITAAAGHVSSITATITSPQSSGYAVGDLFRLNTGTPVVVNGTSFHATGRVTALTSPEAGGQVAAVEIVSWGAYTAFTYPSPLNSPENVIQGVPTVTLTGAGDDGLLVDITTDTPKWTSDSYIQDSPLTQIDWLTTSIKSSNAPTIGLRSELNGVNDGIRLTMGSSYSGILPWNTQPGSPPTNTFYMGVSNQNPKIYISTTERRVNLLVTDGTNRQYGGMGLFIPYTDVASNYPFPAIIHGQAVTVRAFSEIWGTSNRGIAHPIDFSALGCYQYRNNLSSEWFGITAANGVGTQVCRALIWPAGGTESAYSFVFAPVPTGSNATAGNMDPFTSSAPLGNLDEDDFFQTDASSGGPQGPAPLGLNNQMHYTVEVQIIANLVNDVQMIGLVDGWEAVHGRGLNNFDEIQNQNGRRYVVFDDTLSGTLYRWTAMEMV